ERLLAYWPGGFATFDLPQRGVVTVGRAADCDVRVDHSSVSRRHAALHVGRAITAEDLGSFNGTRVNGRRLGSNAPERVGLGEVVEIGLATLVVHGGEAVTGPVSVPSQRAAPAQPRDAVRPLGVNVEDGPSLPVEEATMDRLLTLVDLIAP